MEYNEDIGRLSAEKYKVITILVDNEFGALARIVNLFSGRGYNIESLTVAPVNRARNLAKITVVTFASDEIVDIICRIVERVVPVHHAIALSGDEYIERELLLIKVKNNNKNIKNILEIGKKFDAKIISKNENFSIIEVIGRSFEVDNIISLVSEFDVESISRTGIAAI